MRAGSRITISTAASYRPQVGDVFEIMHLGGRANFSPRIVGLDLGGGLALAPTLTESNLSLTAFTVPVVTNTVTALLAAGAGQLVRFTRAGGQTCTLQASTNPVSWEDLYGGVVTDLIFQCEDPVATRSPRRFYRARLEPRSETDATESPPR